MSRTQAATPHQSSSAPSKKLWTLLVLVALTLLGLANSQPVPNLRVTPLPINGADTAWLLTATALVLLMTPGLAFFYGGMI